MKNKNIDPIVELYLLRGISYATNSQSFSEVVDGDIAEYLDLNEYYSHRRNRKNKDKEVKDTEVLKNILTRIDYLESKSIQHLDYIYLDENLDKVTAILDLSAAEREFLRLIILLSVDDLIEDVLNAPKKRNTSSFYQIISSIICLKVSNIKRICNKKSKLFTSGLAKLEMKSSFSSRIEIINDKFAENMAFSRGDPIDFLIKPHCFCKFD